MDTITGMRTFAAVARQNSFTAGAKSLNISTKLASKYVRQLEEQLGVQLLHRTTRSVTLTDIGQAYVERCALILDQFDELQDIMQERQSELAGPIRITAPTGFGGRELIKTLIPYQQAHPKVNIDLHLSDSHVAIIEEGFDLAIRFGELEDSTLMARKLTDMRVVVVASPEYLSRIGRPANPAALTTHNCLLMQTSKEPATWKFRVENELISCDVSGSFKANSPRAVAFMVAGGHGIGMIPIYAAKPFLENGSLEILFEEYEANKLPLNAVYPPNRHLTTRVRSLIDHLIEALR